jgi:hypothetical protein
MIVLAGVDLVVCHGWCMGENVSVRLLALQRLSQYLKEVIKKCEIGGANILYLGIDVWMFT